MLIEQIMEFQLDMCSATGYFHDKTKIPMENLLVDYCLTLKYCKRQYILLTLPGPNHLQNLTPKYKILNILWT